VAALSTDFARHYSFQPKACRPYRAKTKGKVERPFRYIREDFFLARSFRNLDDLNAQLRHWLDTVANPRVHATTQCVVNEAFAAEKPHLGALPLANRSICCGLRRAWSGSAAPAVGISLTWAFPRFWSRETRDAPESWAIDDAARTFNTSCRRSANAESAAKRDSQGELRTG
jgi:hypothetical protein